MHHLPAFRAEVTLNQTGQCLEEPEVVSIQAIIRAVEDRTCGPCGDYHVRKRLVLLVHPLHIGFVEGALNDGIREGDRPCITIFSKLIRSVP
jgi:hypothetical protein